MDAEKLHLVAKVEFIRLASPDRDKLLYSMVEYIAAERLIKKGNFTFEEANALILRRDTAWETFSPRLQAAMKEWVPEKLPVKEGESVD